MRDGIALMLGFRGEGLSPEKEYRLRHEQYVMEMPQWGERIRGRSSMRSMQEAFPAPYSTAPPRVVGSGRVWVVEAINDYAGEAWHTVVILELDPDGLIVRDTRYYTQKSKTSSWRAPWVETIVPGGGTSRPVRPGARFRSCEAVRPWPGRPCPWPPRRRPAS
jgi:hypothetical protein